MSKVKKKFRVGGLEKGRSGYTPRNPVRQKIMENVLNTHGKGSTTNGKTFFTFLVHSNAVLGHADTLKCWIFLWHKIEYVKTYTQQHYCAKIWILTTLLRMFCSQIFQKSSKWSCLKQISKKQGIPRRVALTPYKS